MYFQKRGSSYSFVYYDSKLKKNVRLSRALHPNVKTEEDAKRFCQKWDAENDARELRMKKRLEWKMNYFNFTELLKTFEFAKREDAPNTWQQYSNLLQHYVFDFFLNKKEENNINNWHYHFEAFREHLQTTDHVRRGGQKTSIAYATMNNIINALNAFIEVMYRRRAIEHRHKCRHFAVHLLNQRDERSVIPSTTQDLIYSALRFRRELSADFFLISLNTGMRLNELLGLSLSDFICDEIDSDFMRRALSPHDFKVFGFISLESQPARREAPRNEKGAVPRKPLKGKRKIDPEQGRIIPIFEKRTHNTITRLWNLQRELYEKRPYGEDLKNYLLFDGLRASIYSSDLLTVQKKLKISHPYSAHDTRHTYSTWLADRTGGNYTLCRMILGHSDLDITMRYVHINSKLKRQMQSKLQLKSGLELVL